MKHFGSVLEFTKERNRELLAAFKHCMQKSRYIRMREIAEQAVRMPASRFWVSEERAVSVISATLRGIDVMSKMRGPKRAMFAEIINRYHAMEQKLPPSQAVSHIIYTPAPEFYISPSRALHIIYKIKNGYYKN